MKKIIILSLVLVFIATGCSLNKNKKVVLTPDEAKVKVAEFINGNLLKPGDKVEIKEVTEEFGLYKMKVALPGGQEITSYATKDGENFFPEIMNIKEIGENNNQDQASAEGSDEVESADIPKKEKPEVELFVMSHCPYGTQIEKGILPAINALGGKVKFDLKFVDYAMHGEKEIDEQLRQVCVQDQGKLNKYLSCFLDKGDSGAAQCLKDAGVDTKKMNSCVADLDKKFKVKENFKDKNKWESSYPPFDTHKADNQKYGVQGSPTLVVNGEKVNSARDSASLLNTICAGFESQPEECDANLSTATPAPGFGSGTSGSDSQAECEVN